MPANELHFSSDFKDIITYCKENELFLGSGNPNVYLLDLYSYKSSSLVEFGASNENKTKFNL